MLKTIIKSGMFLTSVIVAGAAVFVMLASLPGQQPGLQEGQIAVFGQPSTASTTPATTVTIMTWNIAFAYGSGSDGSKYQPHRKSEYERRLDEMADLISATAADVVLLQEIDFDSDKSHNMDQLRYLAEKTGLAYAAYAPSWIANYIPFPYWPPSRHFGAVNSGGAVLSRFPIVGNTVLLHPKPEANPWWYNLFYLYRYTQLVSLDLNGRELTIANNHLEAFDKTSRQEQAMSLVSLVNNNEDAIAIDIYAGDFNTVPDTATRKHEFPDYGGDDYRNDKTFTILHSPSGFAELVSTGAYSQSEGKWFTFPAHQPERRLDYIFAASYLEILHKTVVRTGELSDHLPVVATLKLR